MGRFDEKIMLVTGATSGIGRAVAIRAAKEGATVVAVGAQRRAWSGCCSSNGRSWWKRRIHEM